MPSSFITSSETIEAFGAAPAPPGARPAATAATKLPWPYESAPALCCSDVSVCCWTTAPARPGSDASTPESTIAIAGAVAAASATAAHCASRPAAYGPSCQFQNPDAELGGTRLVGSDLTTT